MSPVPTANRLAWIPRLGGRGIDAARRWRDLGSLVIDVAGTSLQEWGPHGGLVLRNLLLQIRFTGVQALGLVAVTALALGAIVFVEALSLLAPVTPAGYTERTIVFTLVRELPAMLVILILIGRSGTAIATELGNMKLNREVESLEGLGIAPQTYLVLPRLLGFPLCAAALTVYFIGIAVAGGSLLSGILAESRRALPLWQLLPYVHAFDIALPLLKSLLFGLLTAAICCRSGLSVQRSFQEVPQAATRGVSTSLTACLLLNALISVLTLGI